MSVNPYIYFSSIIYMKLNRLLLVLQQQTGSDKEENKTKDCIWNIFLILTSEYS
jgi:hypothetical protein